MLPPEPSVPQSHLPHLKTCPLTPGRPQRGYWSQVRAGERGPLGLQHQQAETERSCHADAEGGVLARAGCVRFSPSGREVDGGEGLRPPRRGSAVLAHLWLLRSGGLPSLPQCPRSGSSPGRCQISDNKAGRGSGRQHRGPEGEVGQGTPCCPSPPHPPAEAEDGEQQLGTWPNETNPQSKQMNPGSVLLCKKQWDLP